MRSKTDIILPLAVVFAVLVLAMPRTAKFNYDYKKGDVWKYETLVSSLEFPLLKTDTQMLADFESENPLPVAYFRHLPEVGPSAAAAAEKLQGGIVMSLIRPVAASSLEGIYERGVVQDLPSETAFDPEVFVVVDGKEAVRYPAGELYSVNSAREKLLADLKASRPYLNVDSLAEKSGLLGLVMPDAVFDRAATDAAYSGVYQGVSATCGYFKAGDVIIEKGAIITPEIARTIDSYKAAFETAAASGRPAAWVWVSNIAIALAFVLVLFFAILYGDPAIPGSRNRYLYILTVYLIAVLATLVVFRINERYLLFVPFTLTALLLNEFFNRKVVFGVYVSSLLPLLLVSSSGVTLFMMFLVAGVLAIFLFRRFDRGWRQFLFGFITFVVMTAAYFAFNYFDITGPGAVFSIIGIFAAAMLPIAGYPLMYLLEKIFNLVSAARLRELCDMGNSLVRKLEQKAPGTFQHSLQVMNMCDAVARRIGADADLVRAGAMYHDIGKMGNPLCFVENESLITDDRDARYHSLISAEESAADISKHVTDGVAEARKAGLPGVIVDFILTHHGTGCVYFFYRKFVDGGGDPSRRPDFCYKGKKPVTKEQVVLMLCDSIEAASRTLPEYTHESISRLVESIVSAKISEGQLDEAEITLKDLEAIKSELNDYIAQLHHARVTYPKLETNK